MSINFGFNLSALTLRYMEHNIVALRLFEEYRYRSEKAWLHITEHKFSWVQIRVISKRGYRSENIGNCGYRAVKAWVHIRERRL